MEYIHFKIYVIKLFDQINTYIYNTVVGVQGGAVQTKTVMVGSAQIQKYMSCEWYPYMLAMLAKRLNQIGWLFFEEITFHGQCRTL